MQLALILLSIFLSSCSLSPKHKVSVTHVIDGDSLFVESEDFGKMELRMLGIDAPEYSQQNWGQAARIFLCEQIQIQQLENPCDFKAQPANISLEFSPQKKDKYGRYLVYAYNSEAKLLNQALLNQGLALVFILGEPDLHSLALKSAEASAREAQLNIWNKESGLELSPYEFRKQKHKKERKASAK